MKPSQMLTWLSIGAMILTAGMWLGTLQQTSTANERRATAHDRDIEILKRVTLQEHPEYTLDFYPR